MISDLLYMDIVYYITLCHSTCCSSLVFLFCSNCNAAFQTKKRQHLYHVKILQYKKKKLSQNRYDIDMLASPISMVTATSLTDGIYFCPTGRQWPDFFKYCTVTSQKGFLALAWNLVTTFMLARR